METHSHAKVKHFLRCATRATRRARQRGTRVDDVRVARSTYEIRALRRYHVRNARRTPRAVVKTRVHARREPATRASSSTRTGDEKYFATRRDSRAIRVRSASRVSRETSRDAVDTLMRATTHATAMRLTRVCGRRQPRRAGTRDRVRTRRSPGRIPGFGVCSPEQIRTAVTALRGRRPRPLDDGAVLKPRAIPSVARGGGLEPPKTGPEPVVLPITPPPNGRD